MKKALGLIAVIMTLSTGAAFAEEGTPASAPINMINGFTDHVLGGGKVAQTVPNTPKEDWQAGYPLSDHLADS